MTASGRAQGGDRRTGMVLSFLKHVVAITDGQGGSETAAHILPDTGMRDATLPPPATASTEMVVQGIFLIRQPRRRVPTYPMRDLPRKCQKCVLTGRFQNRLEADGGWAEDQKGGRKKGTGSLPVGKISHDAMRLPPSLSENTCVLSTFSSISKTRLLCFVFICWLLEKTCPSRYNK